MGTNTKEIQILKRPCIGLISHKWQRRQHLASERHFSEIQIQKKYKYNAEKYVVCTWPSGDITLKFHTKAIILLHTNWGTNVCKNVQILNNKKNTSVLDVQQETSLWSQRKPLLSILSEDNTPRQRHPSLVEIQKKPLTQKNC